MYCHSSPVFAARGSEVFFLSRSLGVFAALSRVADGESYTYIEGLRLRCRRRILEPPTYPAPPLHFCGGGEAGGAMTWLSLKGLVPWDCRRDLSSRTSATGWRA